jgi:hypothetical protein
LHPGGRRSSSIASWRSDYAEPFDRHWHTRICTIAEYLAAAEEAGLQPGMLEDISHRNVHFWTAMQALIQAEAEDHALSPAEAAQRDVSLRARALRRPMGPDSSLPANCQLRLAMHVVRSQQYLRGKRYFHNASQERN